MIINADALTGIKQLPSGSVHCVVTSPPFYGHRDYERCPCASVQSGTVSSSTLESGPKSGNTQLAKKRAPDPNCSKCEGTGKQANLTYIWDARADCAHQWFDEGSTFKQPKPDHVGYNHKIGTRGKQGHAAAVGGERNHGWSCAKCGAWRGQLGLEPTSELYIQHLVQIFRELKRALRDDGVFWLNIGDSFGDNGNLLMIPFQLALALQADGWIVRSDTIWCKGASFGPYVGNVMPEPCNGWRWEQHKINPTRVAEVADNPDRGDGGRAVVAAPWNTYEDCPGCKICTPNNGLVLKKQAWRPTKTHEYLFLLAKTPVYFCDKDAISEPLSRSSYDRMEQDAFWEQEGGEKDGLNPNRSARKGLENLAKQYERAGASARANHAYGEIAGRPVGPSSFARPVLKRNVRSVWQIGPRPYSGAHFAVFPRALVEPCIKVSTAEKVCAACGTQWARVETSDSFRPSCTCNAQPTEATVLDPFAGSGTTLAVAKSVGRKGIGIEPNPVYVELIEKRLSETPPAAFHAEDSF